MKPLILVTLLALAVPVQANTIYTFIQTGAETHEPIPKPQLTYRLDASVTFADGYDFDDLPSLSCYGRTCADPVELFPLLALQVNIHTPIYRDPYTLADFGAVGAFTPQWSMRPGELYLIDRWGMAGFHIFAALGKIQVGSDGSLVGMDGRPATACIGQCTAVGYWERENRAQSAAVVPEPTSLMLLVSGLVCLTARRLWA